MTLAGKLLRWHAALRGLRVYTGRRSTSRRNRPTGPRVTPGSTREMKKVTLCPRTRRRRGDTTRSWYVIDAQDVVLGRLAVEVAKLLRGKHKPTFTPNVDGGDFVIVINAEKVAIGGDKLTKKFAYRHSGYPGGLRRRTIGELLEKFPTCASSRTPSSACSCTTS